MKTNTLKLGFFGVALVLFSMNVSAQLPTTPNPVTSGFYTLFSAAGTTESIDTVTVGSRMAYKTEGDPTIAGLITAGKMAPSDFKWVFSNSQGIYTPGANGTTTAPAAPTIAAHSGYSKDLKEIHTIMPPNATTLTLSVNEWSMLSATKEGCEGQDTSYTIRVVPRPTLQWPATAEESFCANVATSVNILLTLTGYKQWEVTYNLVYYNNFDKTGTPVTKASNVKMTVPANKTLAFAATNFTDAGTYEIQITNITDRISRKSLDQSLVASQTGDIPTTGYTVYALPAPKTQKLQHVKNIP